MDKTDVVFYVLIFCIFTTIILRISIVNSLRKNHSNLYVKLREPSVLSGMGFFAFKIALSTEFKLFSRRDAIAVRLMQVTWVSELILVGLFVAMSNFK